MNISREEVYTLARNIKDYVEKNKKIPTHVTVGQQSYNWGQCAYILAFAINNLNKDFNVPSIENAPNSQGDIINEQIMMDDYKDQAERAIKYINKYSRCPNFIRTVKSKKKVRPKVFIYAFARAIVFNHEKNRLPNYLTYNSSVFIIKESEAKTMTKKTDNKCTNPYTSAPHYTTSGAGKLGQETGYYCAPNCIHQSLKKFGVTKYSQSQIASWAGTTSAGTGHPGIETAIAKISKLLGIKLSVKWYYMSDLGKTTNEQFETLGKIMCKSNTAVFTHIGYQGSGSKATGKIFGHYEMLDKIDIKKEVRALNSLGNKCGKTSYCGHLQWRSYNLEKIYLNNKPGIKSICVITKG